LINLYRGCPTCPMCPTFKNGESATVPWLLGK
jgi:hypothetical protein